MSIDRRSVLRAAMQTAAAGALTAGCAGWAAVRTVAGERCGVVADAEPARARASAGRALAAQVRAMTRVVRCKTSLQTVLGSCSGFPRPLWITNR